MTKIIISALITAGMLIFTGCSAKGVQFTEFKKPLENQGIVYVYRPDALVGSGLSYDIHATNTSTSDLVIGELKNAGYVAMNLPTGATEIWAKTEAKNEVNFVIENGKTYCVRSYVGPGFFVGHPHFEMVDMEKCKTEIKETKTSI